MSAEQSAHLAGYSPSLRRAWSDALELANLQVEVLTQLHEADRQADDVEVQRCVAALDHVMAQVAAAERARTNVGEDASGDASDDASDDAATLDEPTCVACGTLAQPVYDPPRLLGYRCPRCEWTADDPVSQAAGRLDAAKDAAIDEIRQAPGAIGAGLDNVRQRRKKQQHEEGLRELEAVLASLDTVLKRVLRAEEQLRAAQRDAGQESAAPA
jgi:hypothetical protein